jgi:fatty-acyl-CoA synthase
MIRAVRGNYAVDPTSNETIAYQLEKHARGPLAQRPFLRFRDQRYTYEEANRHINRHASAYRELGLGQGDTVALMMENRPQYIWHFLAAGKLGAKISLINPQNSGDPLAHAFSICAPKCVVIGSEVWPRYEQIAPLIRGVANTCIDYHEQSAATAQAELDWSQLLQTASDLDPESTDKQRLGDIAAFIYTSGTTGLPKAALVPHQKFYSCGQAVGGLGLDLEPTDVVYNCLPLYHANSVCIAMSSVITWGSSMVLARKFSATRFWDEVRASEATAFVYIGELCRYLMNQAPQSSDRDNRVRVVTGNGLRADLWEAFQERFGIENVAEFYGSTEGNIGTLNFTNTVGSVGRLLSGVIVKYDDARGEFVRDAKGHLVKCKPGEPGVLLGPISERQHFKGYHDPSATEAKIIRNAFKPGDAYFNTGDVLRMDRFRRLYFVDRMGDSFRWKGENVSTLEVQEQLSSWPPAAITNVYGVQVEGTEGRAGMASLVLKDGHTFDPRSFREHVDSTLPAYARPLFVRVKKELELTATLKLKKFGLQGQGFDPREVDDPLYFRDPNSGDYTTMTAQLYDDVIKGRLRL